MKQYLQELKESVIARMLAPNNESVAVLTRETQIPKDTLYGWKNAALGRVTSSETAAKSSLSSDEKFVIVLETVCFNEHELGEYCRTKGLFTQQVKEWRARCSAANSIGPSRAEQEACAAGARRDKACEVLGLTLRSIQRWQEESALREDGRKAAAQHRTPANAFTPNERAQVLAVVNRPEFADRSPKQIVPHLADQGEYIASESTIAFHIIIFTLSYQIVS